MAYSRPEKAAPAVPNTGAITVVAFDDVAAVELGTKFPAPTKHLSRGQA